MNGDLLNLRPPPPHFPLIQSNEFMPEIQGKKRAPTGLPRGDTYMTSALRGGGGVSQCVTNTSDRLRECVTKGGRGSKIPKILRTSFKYRPLCINFVQLVIIRASL